MSVHRKLHTEHQCLGSTAILRMGMVRGWEKITCDRILEEQVWTASKTTTEAPLHVCTILGSGTAGGDSRDIAYPQKSN